MQRQTFIDHMKERGYNITRKPNGNVKATKGGITVRWVSLADYGVHIKTSAVTAITAKDATDAETLHIIDVLTVQP